MACLDAKIGWISSRKRENKNYRSVPFQIDAQQKIPKKQQKNSRNYKIPLWLLLKPKQSGKGRGREKIKIIVPFFSKSMRNRKFQKNSNKIQKIKNYHYGVISSQNRLEKAQREKIKIIVSFRFVPT